MDEVLFRSSQKLENLQFQLGVVATEGKKALVQYSSLSKQLAQDLLNSSQSQNVQEAFKKVWCWVLSVSDEIKCAILFHIDPRRLLNKFARVFGTTWTKRDVYFGCAGLIIGGLIGIGVGMAIHNQKVFKFMHAVQCTSYIGVEGAVYVEDAIAPIKCGKNEVVVNVKAGSVQILDADICRGYGGTLRRILAPYCQYSKHDLPVTLGRDCSGIVTEIGQDVENFDIGDEVWLTSPFWGPGTLSEFVQVLECKVAKKPKTIGFESASSLPYPGSLALAALEQAQLTEDNVKSKRIFVQGGCSPVGCILIQILNMWGAQLSTSCYKRAAPVATALGVDDVLLLSDPEIKTKNALNIKVPEITADALCDELRKREKYDVIINTTDCGIPNEKFYFEFCNPEGSYVTTMHGELGSDTYNGPLSLIYGMYIRIKSALQRMMGYELCGYGEIHMCQSMLEQLTYLVEEGHIKTLVDKVYHPTEIDKALNHIQSTESIGGHSNLLYSATGDATYEITRRYSDDLNIPV